MKSVLALVALCFLAVPLLSQDVINYNLTVRTSDNKPVANLKVVAVEKTSMKEVTGATNAQGVARLSLIGGSDWAIAVGEIKNAMFAESRPGNIYTINKSYIYDVRDYRRRLLQNPGRSKDKFKVISQTAKDNAPIGNEECLLRVVIRKPEGTTVPGVQVDAVNVKDSLIYRAVSDDKGMAYFVLPNRRSYDVDINAMINFNYADFGDERKIQTLYLVYIPTELNEKVINDTTFQDLNSQVEPTSERNLVQVTVRGGKKGGIQEQIYLRELNSGKVYAATTDRDGHAFMMVPPRLVYMIDFNYQRDADAVSLKYAEGFFTTHVRVRYAPDPRLEYPETFIPTPDRLFLKNFNTFLEKQYAKPKDKPFNFMVKSANRIHKNSREALFLLTLAGAETYGNVRLPMNAALVLDKSGSMYSDGRSEALRASLLNIAEVLSATDVVSVVLFDDKASIVDNSGSKYRQALQTVADNYAPGGGTNILSGLQSGAEAVLKRFDKNKSNKIILLTDGYGDNPPEEITDFVSRTFAAGVEFSTIGLGTDYNQSMLELIATKGNGTFSFVDSVSALSDAFLAEMKSSLLYAVRDLTVEIFQNEKLIFSSLYGYPVKTQTNQKVTFEIGKVPFGRNDIAFLKYKLNKPSREIESMPLKVIVSYFDLSKNQQVRYEQVVKLQWTEETKTELLLDQEEKTLYAIAILNQSLKLMAESNERQDRTAARAALEDGKRQIEEIFPAAKPKDVQVLFEEVDRYIQLFNQMEKNK
jgi:hypothetical protein